MPENLSNLSNEIRIFFCLFFISLLLFIIFFLIFNKFGRPLLIISVVLSLVNAIVIIKVKDNKKILNFINYDNYDLNQKFLYYIDNFIIIGIIIGICMGPFVYFTSDFKHKNSIKKKFIDYTSDITTGILIETFILSYTYIIYTVLNNILTCGNI